jgi:hypothetical protein
VQNIMLPCLLERVGKSCAIRKPDWYHCAWDFKATLANTAGWSYSSLP